LIPENLSKAKNPKMELERIHRRIIHIKEEGIEWEEEDGNLLKVVYSSMKKIKMNHEAIAVFSNDNMVHSIKLIGLSKEEQFKIKSLLDEKSENGSKFTMENLG